MFVNAVLFHHKSRQAGENQVGTGMCGEQWCGSLAFQIQRLFAFFCCTSSSVGSKKSTDIWSVYFFSDFSGCYNSPEYLLFCLLFTFHLHYDTNICAFYSLHFQTRAVSLALNYRLFLFFFPSRHSVTDSRPVQISASSVHQCKSCTADAVRWKLAEREA